MRSRIRLIFPLALVAVVAVAAIAMAADDGAGGQRSTGASADTPTAYAANGGSRERGRRFHGGPPDADVRVVLDSGELMGTSLSNEMIQLALTNAGSADADARAKGGAEPSGGR